MKRVTMGAALGGVRTLLQRAATRSFCWAASFMVMIALAACDFDIFEPTPTGHSVRRGIVTSAIDGSPIEGAKVYPVNHGWLVGGGGIVINTAVTDAAGRYRLDTDHYCGAQLAAEAAGYVTVTAGLSWLGCGVTPSNLVVDIRLRVGIGVEPVY